MATDRLMRLFTDETRVRAFAAVTLGAETSEEVARAAGLSAKDAALALLKLREQGVVSAGDGGELRVVHEVFREAARVERTEAAPENPGSRDERTLQIFVREGRLVRLPAQWTRKKVVLQYIAEQTFEPGVEYPERAVNEKLRGWCEDGDVDHVTLRRHLVDLHHLDRSEGIYRRAA
ncbi:DUF2087 domain-containing protein [Streptomyces sp. NBC_00140]|uniref:DUF2087 domain-containing protein n=1 Tax=Streptomyces sp. NBC_00140 TaxID=2975664 RepID=UPI00225909EF|nr:DUF2087 domain-containing protein [Streptomyces sp. NBC_00140]MCX5333992.1 DUF2087 domain-containing protein [Streptomyces sp. NBC_00140]